MKTFTMAAIAVLALFFAPTLHACVAVEGVDFTTAYRGDGNKDFNDYGRLFVDAADPNCAENAMYNLTAKLQNHLNSSPTAFQNGLDGYFVALIYGTALRLGEQGWANKDLDYQLDFSPDGRPTLSERFVHAPFGSCDNEVFNTCMDDHAGSAAGFAWMAAYKSKRPNHNTQADVNAKLAAAQTHIQASMASVCIRKTPLDRDVLPVCDGTVADLEAGTAQTLSVNGGQQIIHYGFGLMTSVLSAAQGYEAAGGGKYGFSPDEQAIAKGLYEEIARHADASGNYPNADCIRMENGHIIPLSQNGGTRCDGVNTLGQNPSYLPNMYNLKQAYDYYFPNVIPNDGSGVYNSNSFSQGLFLTSDHFGYGRMVTYRDQGWTWFRDGAPIMPNDINDPTGWLDYVDANGVAYGWTCDQDTMYRQASIKVDIYASNSYTFAATGWANLSSEPAVNAICGGNAHRFAVQLPSWTRGLPIYAFGLDFTWYGYTQLPCGSGPCSW